MTTHAHLAATPITTLKPTHRNARGPIITPKPTLGCHWQLACQCVCPNPWVTVTIAAALLTALASPALAADRFWIDPNGGSFTSTSNWSLFDGGGAGASIPVATDVANFTLPDTYTVFVGTTTNFALDISNGKVTFDLNGNTYTTTSTLGMDIGDTTNQTGRLTITDGTLTTDSALDDIRLGTTPTAIGYLTVSTGGTLGSPGFGDIFIGSSGSGFFTIKNGGDANTRFTVIGSSSGSTGTATVTGIGSIWSLTSTMTIGNSGNGTLNIFGGGSVSTTSFATIANVASSTSKVQVSGTDSTWSLNSNLNVGGFGNGSLTISSGGVVTSSSGNIASNSVDSVGSVSVSGTDSRWDNSFTLFVGRSGHGTLSVRGGATVTSGNFTIANFTNSQGAATISDPGSSVAATGSLTVGASGTGTLTVENGAQLSTVSTARIGNQATAVGTLTVRGQGTQWSNNGSAIVAGVVGGGTGTLNVSDGADVSINGSLSINDPNGAQVGTLNFDGGTITAQSFTRTGNLNWTDGTLKINGGTFNNSFANLTIDGADDTDLPTLHMAAGATGTGFAATTLTVANTKRAALDITGGSSLSVSNVIVGNLDSSEGTVTVAGTASSLTAGGQIFLGTTGGNATLNIKTGGTVTSNNSLQIGAGATVNLDGGTLLLDSLITFGGTFNFNAGQLTFENNMVATDLLLDAVLGQFRQLLTGRRLDANATLFLFSSLSLDGGDIVANTIDISGSNALLQASSGLVSAANGITVGSTARATIGSATINAGATLTNAGRITMSNPLGRITGTSFTNTGTLEGTGQIDAPLANQLTGKINVRANDRLLFTAAANTNAGRIDVNGQNALATIEFQQGLTNDSTARIDARGSASLQFNGGLTNNGLVNVGFADATLSGPIINNGSIGVAFSNATFAAGDIANNGSIFISGNSNVLFSDDVTNGPGAGVTLQVDIGSKAVFFGSYNGGNPGNGTVFIHGDLAPGSSPGTSTFGGPVSFGPLSTTIIEIEGTTAGTGYDKVVATQSVSLGGTLDIQVVDPTAFTPAYGNAFTILTYASRTGTYNQTTLNNSILALQTDLALAPVYDFPGNSDSLFAATPFAAAPDTLTLFTTLPGDANLDLRVEDADLSLLLTNFGNAGAAWTAGDFTGDGIVDDADLSLLLTNFGGDVRSLFSSTGLSTNASTIPEPASGAVLALCGMLMLARRRRCR